MPAYPHAVPAQGAARPSLDPGILPTARKRVGHRQCNAAIAGSFQEVMASWRPVLLQDGQARDFAGDADGTCQHVLYGYGQRNVFKSPLRGIRDGPQFAWRTRFRCSLLREASDRPCPEARGRRICRFPLPRLHPDRKISALVPATVMQVAADSDIGRPRCRGVSLWSAWFPSSGSPEGRTEQTPGGCRTIRGGVQETCEVCRIAVLPDLQRTQEREAAAPGKGRGSRKDALNEWSSAGAYSCTSDDPVSGAVARQDPPSRIPQGRDQGESPGRPRFVGPAVRNAGHDSVAGTESRWSRDKCLGSDSRRAGSC